MDEHGSVVMRKIIFRKGPYLAWYAYDPDDSKGEVWLLRLFHSRQRDQPLICAVGCVAASFPAPAARDAEITESHEGFQRAALEGTVPHGPPTMHR